MKKEKVDFVVGLFVIAGVICFAYLSIRFAGQEISGGDMYPIRAAFENLGGLRTGASVEIAGVPIGKVKKIVLDEDYEGEVQIMIRADVKLPEDTIASIKTKGLIGEKYISLSPGGEDVNLKANDKIVDTESALDIEALISKIAFGKVD